MSWKSDFIKEQNNIHHYGVLIGVCQYPTWPASGIIHSCHRPRSHDLSIHSNQQPISRIRLMVPCLITPKSHKNCTNVTSMEMTVYNIYQINYIMSMIRVNRRLLSSKCESIVCHFSPNHKTWCYMLWNYFAFNTYNTNCIHPELCMDELF